MSDMGSHGGSSPAETKVPLVFMSPLLDRKSKKSNGTISLLPAKLFLVISSFR